MGVPGPASLAHLGSSRGRGNLGCTFTGSLCVCISCQRLPHPSLEVLVPESSAALNPLSSWTKAVLVCAGPLPSAAAGWEVLQPSPEPAIALPSSTSCWGQEPPPDGWNAASRDWKGHLPSLCSSISPSGDDICVPWGVESPLPPVCPGTPMLCQERHPPLPPWACSSGMRMGLVLSPGCLVLLSCPFPRPLPVSRPRDEESRAGTGRARAAAACGDPAFSPCGPQS